MGTRIYFLTALLIIMFAACKKDGGNNNSTKDIADNLATILSVQNGASKVYCDTLFVTHDSVQAINAMGQWLLNQPEVKEVFFWSYDLAEVYFQNGLQSTITFVKVDANGKPLSRGGSGSGSGLTKFASFKNQEASEEEIGNNKVLVLNPFEDEFYSNNYSKRPLFDGGPEELDVTIINGDAVNYSVLNTLGNYGFIILNTHGLPQGFILRKFIEIPPEDFTKVWTRQELLDALSPYDFPMEKFENGELRLNIYQTLQDFKRGKSQVHILVTDRLIRNAPFSLDRAVVFGNHCWSGYTASGTSTYNMAEAWKSKGAISYYGYGYNDGNSDLVLCPFADEMEDSLIINLARKGDTTGIAHLKNDNIIQEDLMKTQHVGEVLPILLSRGNRVVFKPVPPGAVDHLKFKHYFYDNYSYSKCDEPITDARDGQKYSTVCIGEQVWMAENLRYNAPGSIIANDDPTKLLTYGRLYDYPTVSAGQGLSPGNQVSTVQGICPDGWHLPNNYEWGLLMASFGIPNTNDLAIQLKSPYDWVGDNFTSAPKRNASGFDALPTGGALKTISTGAIEYYAQYNFFEMWLSSSDSLCPFPNYAGLARLLSADAIVQGGNSPSNPYDGTYQAVSYSSCRCVKD